MKVAVVGATGMVGQIMLKVLAERNFPITELIPVASERSVGKTIDYMGTSYTVVGMATAVAMKADVALFSAGGETSLEWAPKFADAGTTVIDNSSAWRMDPTKKLVVPEINAGSMADIAFLLLIFFLVTTTMDVDKGLLVKLPPWTEDQVEPPQDIKEKNIFVVLVNAQDQLLIESEYATLEDVRRLAKEFIDNNGDGTCEDCRGLRDPASSDNPGKAVISLQNDRGTSYNMFVKVRNELLGAYSELRNDLATRKYGRDYESLSESDKEEVNAAYPQFISEAEPVQVGG